PFLARYNASGNLDTSLAGTGILPLTRFQNDSSPQVHVALQSDGKLVLTWSTQVIRLNADGSLDTVAFGPLNPDGSHTGYATLALPFLAGAVQVQGNGKIVVANGDQVRWQG